MSVVALIPTGKLEHIALAPSLKRLFPEHEFVVRPHEGHLDGFTSAELKVLGTDPIRENLDELAMWLVNSIFPSRKDRRQNGRVDFAFVIEDLELANDAQPEIVLRLFRDAVQRCLFETFKQSVNGEPDEVRNRCSFHLFRPMTEAYFFGETDSLIRAGAQRDSQLPSNLDIEQFRTIDPDYLAIPAGNKRIPNHPNRERHPKSYLDFLCDPSLGDRKKKYKETRGGVCALRTLDWQQVLSGPPHCPFLQAFLDDLAQALNSPLSFVSRNHADHRCRFPGPQNAVLRNL